MNDTSPQIMAKMVEMIQRKTPAERLAAGCSMFDFSRQLIISSLRSKNPGISGSELRKELFRIFYSNDFDAKYQLKISEYLSNYK
jgi:hypothetical protein